MIRLEVITIFLILGMFGISPSYCDDQIDEDRIKTVNGAVSAINWVKSTISVRWLEHSRTMTYDEISIFVPKKVKISKGTDVISLSTLNIFDRVIVQYYDDPNDMGALTALSIRVVK
ncbi:MAG: hypothetical protein WAX79_06275 [Candidatus Omnitrophota bacterium]